MPELFVFRAGKYPQGDWPVERVKKLVDSYDPETSLEAPAVIGHRSFAMRDADQFAHGWVESLRMEGDKVFATINDFSLEARHAIAEKKLRYISVEIFEFDKVNKDDPPYLRAVALLGRDTPAVAGTKIPAMFSKDFSGGVVTADEENHISVFTRKMNAEDIQNLSASEGQETNQEEFAMAKTAEELAKELEESNRQSAAFQKELADLKNAGRKKEAESFFTKLRDEGKLPPAVFEKAVALDTRLGDEDRAELRSVFSALEVKVDLSGKHTADKKDAPESPAGFGSDLTAKIRAYQKEHKLASFAEAADAMFAEKPELFNEEESNG